MDRTVMGGPAASASKDQLTDDAFLGGALQILQPRSGHRAGLDAVMLAAAIPVGPRGPLRILDVGAGVGTAGLCLARRVGSAQVVLFEREAALARIAAENAKRNALAERVRVVEGEVGLPAPALRALGLAEGSFDHVMANPPFHALDAGTVAPDPRKADAHAMAQADLERWARFMTRMTKAGGGISVIHKADALLRLLAVLEGRFGALRMLPLYPRAGAAAHRIIVQGTKGSRGPLQMLSGFVLHGEGDAFTAAAQAILRAGAPLPMTPLRS